MEFTEHEREILYGLEYWHRSKQDENGARPLDLGGSNGSHHSYTLNKLIRRGLVERKKRGPLGSRGAYRYSLTEQGISIATALVNRK